MHKVKITITGEKVHDIGYRLFLLDEAEGWFIPYFDARNVKIKGKQAVVAIAGGDEEKVRDLVEYVKSTPYENASVSSIEVEDHEGDIRTVDSFRNSFSTRQLFKIANIGVNMLEKQDTTIDILKSVKEDTGKMLEKQDSMLGKQDSMLEKQDSMLEKQDETIWTIKDEGEKTRDTFKGHLSKDMARLYEEIDNIKATLARVVEKVGGSSA